MAKNSQKKNPKARKQKTVRTVTTVQTRGSNSKPKQPRQQQARTSLASVARAAVITADQEEQWKFGMLDPEHGARGPGTSQLPTVILTYRSVTDITTTAYASGGTTPFQVDSTGGALLVITPIALNATTAANAANPFSGLWCSTNDNLLALNSGSFGSTDLQTSATTASHAPWNDPVSGQAYVPVKTTFLQNFQGAFPVAFQSDISDFQIYQPWRVAGLRATLTQTTSALNAQGSCASGDFGDFFYTVKQGIEPDILGTTEDVVVQTVDITTPEWAVNQGNGLSRFIQVGSLAEPGVVYEAVALPVNEQFWQYHNSAQEISASNFFGQANFQTLYSTLQFIPAVGFLLRGIAAGNTFRLNVTLSLEVQVDLSTPLAFLYNSARFTDGYFPNLRDLRMVPTGGHLGELMAMRASGCEGCAILLAQRVTNGGQVTRGRSGNTYVRTDSGSAPPTPLVGAISPIAPAAQMAASTGGVFSTIMKDMGSAAVWVGKNAPQLYNAGQLAMNWGSRIWETIRGAAPIVEEAAELAPLAIALGKRTRKMQTTSYGSYNSGRLNTTIDMSHRSGNRVYHREITVPMRDQQGRVVNLSYSPDAQGRLQPSLIPE